MNENRDTVRLVLCDCLCHWESSVMHIRPCCEGRCPKCGFWFASGLRQHIATCNRQPDRASPDSDSAPFESSRSNNSAR
jgi:hypothetical protein